MPTVNLPSFPLNLQCGADAKTLGDCRFLVSSFVLASSNRVGVRSVPGTYVEPDALELNILSLNSKI